jgi:hypothetical protein
MFQYKILQVAIVNLMNIVTYATLSLHSKGWVISGYPYLPICRISNCCYVIQEVFFSWVLAAKKSYCLIRDLS